VCTGCQQELASKLRRAAGLWEHVQDTVGYLVSVQEGTRPARPARRAPIGPVCAGRHCEHESCEAIWKTEIRWRRDEPAGSREEKGLLDLNALENSWVVSNTAGSWSRHVADKRGNRPPARRPIIGAQTLHAIPDEDRPDLCVLSDLPFDQCAAHPGRPHQAAR
jgi:hypothetical protein